MIKIILDPQGYDKSISGVTIDCQGNAFEIAADFGLAIGDIYSGMKNRDPRMAKMFRSAIQAIVLDVSPTWDMELPPVPGSVHISAVVPRGKK